MTSRSNDASGARTDRPRVGVSDCLLGHEVRHDGGHKRDLFVVKVLDDYFEWVPVCPEVEVGMGTPREPLRLARRGEAVHMITVKTGVDWTERMVRYSEQRTRRLAEDRLRGFILKKDSPSCGMERVKVYDHNGVPSKSGRGLFAERLLSRLPNLPVEEEGRLNDKPLRENFIGRVYAYHRWRSLLEKGATPAAIVDFHARHKLLLMAHDPATYYEMGPLVARAGKLPIEELADAYETMLMGALDRPAPAGRHVNTLQHILGFLKDALSGDDKAEILRVIDEYRQGIVPLVAPLALLKFHLRKSSSEWIKNQVYLDPYPAKLALRSHL